MLTETAPAKINLALHVRARRPDGYHDLETLFVFARDGDRVSLADAEASTFAMTGRFADVVGPDADNLVVRAAAAFRAAFGIARHHAITLDKHLPVASGIGGGSADAAATLRALARRHDVAVDDPRLVALAAGLGADVPACLLGRAAFGSGRGDALAPIAGLGDMPVLLVNPLVPVSTAAVFAGWDGVDRGAITGGDDTLARGIAGRNDLQPAAERVAPQVAQVLAILREQAGVVLARMSGSGATCFALFRHAADRDAAAAAVAARQPDWWQLASMIA
ncbi:MULTISPECIES: 4-(cytidine 5'-diphospho)-2-C-methyl-D-erythritol kinase [Sphingomonas]|uniref:4-diphosphocytidyl-2-C-methyl-D-erythritol kinase n=1 Tax=Sphingomonas adhaesiva TaxID=28212 RepID=A0A2A4ICU1_9SPHN|nr:MULTISPECIES: 4-(cytidine 5'-diphospho)-2-C-methyl-D-erythritol kinase [Sphingomonas]PCG15640.1 4-(cytidine 5'-diphospho)-2-C-methyl-D-erythritol kinase [Sphingomonas adhaesiva]PZU79535.1 MAG: 4-(cytidine 5'-diphospho)-2-C-methyl-D-erythritol kinase [Sphingomonas sp.]